MGWTIEILDSAKKGLRRLDRQNARRITDFLHRRLAELDDPRSIGDSLHGPLREYWRYRVGDYRIVCSIQDRRLVVLVVEIGHRSEVYR